MVRIRSMRERLRRDRALGAFIAEWGGNRIVGSNPTSRTESCRPSSKAEHRTLKSRDAGPIPVAGTMPK